MVEPAVAEAVRLLVNLAALLLAIGGCLLMVPPLRRHGTRALLLAVAAAMLAGAVQGLLP